ncbi:MAG: xylulokinase, partial [bacterium]|nr:xylulokinase [bacterium]
LSGGGARSAFWRQLQADIYGTTCATINTEEGPAYGAALLASVGAGEYGHIRQAVKAGISITRRIKPVASSKRIYAKHYAQYRELYPALKDQFGAIAEL